MRQLDSITKALTPLVIQIMINIEKRLMRLRTLGKVWALYTMPSHAGNATRTPWMQGHWILFKVTCRRTRLQGAQVRYWKREQLFWVLTGDCATPPYQSK